jgi:hypothetical protein
LLLFDHHDEVIVLCVVTEKFQLWHHDVFAPNAVGVL